MRRSLASALRIVPAALAAAAALACSGDGTGPKEKPGTPGVNLLTTLPTADSIGAALPELAIQVRDGAGLLARATTVEVEALVAAPPECTAPCAPGPTVLFRPDGAAAWSARVTLTTDASGVARTRAMLGDVPGQAGFGVGVPGYGYNAVFHVTARVGAVARIELAPADTAVLAGNGYLLRVKATDRLGNPVTDPVTLTAGDELGLNNPQFGVVFGRHYGRGEIVATAGEVTARAYASVVPYGELASTRDVDGAATTVVVMHMNGGQRREFRIPSHHTAEDWNSEGDVLLLRFSQPGQPQRISTLTLADGVVRTVLDGASGLGFTSLTDPRFSPDGKWVYFSGTGSGAATPTLWRIRPGDPIAQQVFASGADQSASAPDLAPSGTELVYSGRRAPGDGPNDLYLYNLVTGAHTALLHDSAAAPRWSTGGTAIAFIGSGSRPNVIRSDGTGRTVLVNLPVRSIGGWSAEGRWVVARGDSTWLAIDATSGLVVPVPKVLSGQLLFPLFMPPVGLEGVRRGRTDFQR